MIDALTHPVLATILFLGILVFVHEAGHFLVGKLCGIGVETFSIGFGPTIVAFNSKETSYRVSIIPLGGYVKFYGSVSTEDVPADMVGREFYKASIPARLATIAAGPIANFFLAIFVFTIIAFHGVKHPPALVGELMPNSPADKSGLEFNDKILEINELEVKTWKDLQRIVADHPGVPLKMKILRGNTTKNVVVTPEEIVDKELARSKGRIGISPNFVPAIVTVTDPNGLAGKAGIRTGLRITGVSLDGSPMMPIKYWRQIEAFFETKKISGAKSLTLQGHLAPSDPRKDDKGDEKSNFYQIDISTLNVLTPEVLGLSDGQLTIGTFLDPIEGLEVGDKILAWNQTQVKSAFTLSEIISNSLEPSTKLKIVRNGVTQDVSVNLKPVEVQRAEGRITLYTLPVMFWGALEQAEFVEEIYRNPFSALGYGITETWIMSKNIAGAVLGLFTGDMPLKALGGPIAIAKVASDSVKMGLVAFMHLLALISINLGLLNLIPIPILDGGQLLLVGAEGVARKPLPQSIVEGYQKVGFVMVMALIVMATYNDLGRFWASMFSSSSSF